MTRTTAADRWRISDALWAKLQPLLPERPNTHRFGGGRPRESDRACAATIFFRLRTGCQWKALDATGICPGSTAHDRFQEWAAAGVFLAFWKAGLREYGELRGIDWAWLSMDGCMTKAPLGGGKTGRNPTDRGKRGVKRSLLTEGGWNPGRGGRRGGQPERLQDGPGDHREHPRRAARADHRGPASTP